MLLDVHLWGTLMKSKYLKICSVKDWIRRKSKMVKGGLNLWNGLVRSFLIMGKWIVWKIGERTKSQLGDNLWFGGAGCYRPS